MNSKLNKKEIKSMSQVIDQDTEKENEDKSLETSESDSDVGSMPEKQQLTTSFTQSYYSEC